MFIQASLFTLFFDNLEASNYSSWGLEELKISFWENISNTTIEPRLAPLVWKAFPKLVLFNGKTRGSSVPSLITQT